jgi:UDPglucose 6-dehydrogenase
VTQGLVGTIVEANRTRRDFVADEALRRASGLVCSGVAAPVVGACRLATRTGSDNFRANSVQGVTRRVKGRGVPRVVYVPTLGDPELLGSEVTRDLEGFKRRFDLIVSSRRPYEQADARDKAYARGLFGRD